MITMCSFHKLDTANFAVHSPRRQHLPLRKLWNYQTLSIIFLLLGCRRQLHITPSSVLLKICIWTQVSFRCFQRNNREPCVKAFVTIVMGKEALVPDGRQVNKTSKLLRMWWVEFNPELYGYSRWDDLLNLMS